MKKIISTAAIASALCAASTVSAETIDIGILYTDQSAAATSNINTKINQLIALVIKYIAKMALI